MELNCWQQLEGQTSGLSQWMGGPQPWIICCSVFQFYSWSIIALQCSVSFCCMMKWISYMYTHIPFLLSFPPILLSNPTLLGHHRAAQFLTVESHHVLSFFSLVGPLKCFLIWQTLPKQLSPLCPEVFYIYPSLLWWPTVLICLMLSWFQHQRFLVLSTWQTRMVDYPTFHLCSNHSYPKKNVSLSTLWSSLSCHLLPLRKIRY